MNAVHFYIVKSGSFDVIVDANLSENQLIEIGDEVQAVFERQGDSADKQIVAQKGIFASTALL